MTAPETFHDGRVTLWPGDCLATLDEMPENSVDAVCADPPYHLHSIVKRFGANGAAPAKAGKTGAYARASKGFMSKTWDGGDIAFRSETWAKVLRVLKPGGYIVAFSSSRTFGRMSVAIEDAGFITHPMIGWLFGSGFPKATRIQAPGYDGQRYGAQALKPALEPIFCGSKPFSDCSFATELVDFQNSLEVLLWSLASAKTVEVVSTNSQVAQGASVRWLACVQAKLQSGDLSDVMATFRSQEEASTFLSIALLWSAICGGNLRSTSTSTIGMASSTTTELKILKSWISAIMPENIIQAATRQNGVWSVVPDAGKKFGGWPAFLTNIQKHSATGPAISDHAKRILRELANIAERNFLLPPVTIENIVRDPAQTSPGQSEPALEPIYVGQKPFSEATGTANILRWGTGAVRIDDCRVETSEPLGRRNNTTSTFNSKNSTPWVDNSGDLGRWPPNLVHDGSPEVLALFPESDSRDGRDKGLKEQVNVFGAGWSGGLGSSAGRNESGSAARFFPAFPQTEADCAWYGAKADSEDRLGSKHPTIKPLDLMRWLVRLHCPKGGLVLDPFAGTGTTGHAALIEGCRAVLCEADPEHCDDIRRRMGLVYAGRDERARRLATRAETHGPLFADAAE